MLPEPELRRALAEIPAVPLHGPFNRFVAFEALVSPLKHGWPPRPLWGIGSIKNGGRYNRPERFEVIYLAEDPITALAEVNLVFRPSPELGKIKGPPVVLISVDGILPNVLDITSAAAQSALCTSHQELTGDWLWQQASTGEASTQLLGRIGFESKRLSGLRYPSSKNPGGICVAVFADRLGADSYLEVFDPFDHLAQRIPPTPST
jgi:RES domain-containing protein